MAEPSPPEVAAPPAGGHLSIGEVLALLLEEFPDVTISKIRFLESQGLIDPERTASGYRKFYADDVELLRCILREQRENYLPLRVIKDRIDSGEIDPTGEQPRPRGIKNVGDASDVPRPDAHPSAGRGRTEPQVAPSANGGGGEKYVERHLSRGRILPRKRIEMLLDRDSYFLEIAPLAGHAMKGEVSGSSVVGGVGVVSGVECVIVASEATVKGGAVTPILSLIHISEPTRQESRSRMPSSA